MTGSELLLVFELCQALDALKAQSEHQARLQNKKANKQALQAAAVAYAGALKLTTTVYQILAKNRPQPLAGSSDAAGQSADPSLSPPAEAVQDLSDGQSPHPAELS